MNNSPFEDDQNNVKLFKKKLELTSVSTAKIHAKSLKCAALDLRRCLVYSTDTEKGILVAFDLKTRRPSQNSVLKTSNARINRIVIDSD